MSKKKIIVSLSKEELKALLENMEDKEKYDSGASYINLIINTDSNAIKAYQPCVYAECNGTLHLEKNFSN